MCKEFIALMHHKDFKRGKFETYTVCDPRDINEAREALVEKLRTGEIQDLYEKMFNADGRAYLKALDYYND